MLSSLPSTRPQRPSARRIAARRITAVRSGGAARAAEAKSAQTAKPAAKARPAPVDQAPTKPTAKTRPTRADGTPTRPTAKTRPTRADETPTKPPAKTRPARARRTPRPSEPPVPRQGFEAEEEIELGRSVQPPSGTELAVSVAELFGELAQAGLSTGERLLKDALTRLSGG